MTYNEVLENEDFRNSFGDKSEQYLKAYRKLVETSDIGDCEIKVKVGFPKTPEEKEASKKIAASVNNFPNDHDIGWAPGWANVFWFAWHRVTGWWILLVAVCSLIVWLYDQSWWVYLTWIVPGMGAAWYYGPAVRCDRNAYKVAKGIKINPQPSKVNLTVSIVAVLFAMFINFGLQDDESNASSLSLAVQLYVRQSAGDTDMEESLAKDSSYYEVSKSPELLDSGNYSAVVKINMLKMFKVLLSDDSYCNQKEGVDCEEFIEAAGYSSVNKMAAAMVKTIGSPTAKVKLEYSVEDLGDGEIYVTLEDYTEY